MIPTLQVSPEFLALIAGAALSLLFSWFPKLNTWFAKFTTGQKQLLMTLFLLFTTATVFAVGCLSLVSIPDFTCTQVTAVRFFWLFFYAAFTNQTTFALTPEAKAVRAVKLMKLPAPPDRPLY